jgi:voltage-gated potassium channel Kch
LGIVFSHGAAMGRYVIAFQAIVVVVSVPVLDPDPDPDEKRI